MKSVTLPVNEVRQLVINALVANNTSIENAHNVADALIAAEIDGQAGHGLSRISSYAAQAASGKVNGRAVASATRIGPVAWRIDAKHGFAFPALALAVEKLAKTAPEHVIGIAAIHNSHHFGQGGYHVEKLAKNGLIGLVFGNSPKAIAPWGGTAPLLGTNPVAFAAPRRSHPPLVIDLSLSKVARGKVMLAAKKGEAIPEGWALDIDGNPTTDPHAALEGSMLPMGDAKGAALVLMVEILAAALTGANYGFEASSFFDAEGPAPGVGQLLIAINQQALSGESFTDRLEALVSAILEQPGTRLPGAKLKILRENAYRSGISIAMTQHRELMALSR